MDSPKKPEPDSEAVNTKPRVGVVPSRKAQTPLFTFPPWVTNNLRSKKSLKVWFRCWLACWLAFVVMLPNASLRALGNVAFFTLIASFLVPPNLPVQLYAFLASTLLIGMCFGWGIGSAAMKAALAVRDKTATNQELFLTQQSARGAVNPDAVFALAVFQGQFLDTKSSIIYGVFLAVGAFFLALARAYVPKLVFFSVFGSVVLDVLCCYGPLFPIPQYTIVSSILIAASTYVAIGLLAVIFIFPETMNHAYLDFVADIIGKLAVYVELQEEVLGLTPEAMIGSGEGGEKNPVLKKCLDIRAGLYGMLQAMTLKFGLIGLEFSWGRWSSHDVTALEGPLRLLISRLGCLVSFPILVEQIDSSGLVSRQPSKTSSTSSIPVSFSYDGDTHLIRLLNAKHRTHEAEHNVRMSDVLPILRSSTSDLRKAIGKGLGAAHDAIEQVNRNRWKREPPSLAMSEEGVVKAINELKERIKEFNDSHRAALVKPYIPALRSLHQTKPGTDYLPTRTLVVAFVYAAPLVSAAQGLVEFLVLIDKTMQKRKRSRVWAPGSLGKLWRVLRKRDDGTEEGIGEDARPEESVVGVKEGSYQLDPDSRPPTNVLQKIANRTFLLYAWFKTPEVVFSLKYVVVTILLWLPSVFRSSAYFTYVQKSIWAIVMAQSTLNIYVADQLYNTVARVSATFAGLVVGLLAWYIGNGRGDGNAFGAAASYGLFLLPIVFFRIFAPPTYTVPASMFSITYSLIVGYSWIDTHLPLLGNPGVGWSVAWKRWVLVVVGAAAAFIFMFFPPRSGRKVVRLRNATVVTEISSLYAFLISTWIVDAEDVNQNHNSNAKKMEGGNENENEKANNHNSAGGSEGEGGGGDVSDMERGSNLVIPYTTGTTTPGTPKWMSVFREKIIALIQQIQGLKTQTAVAKWEGGLRGKWPSEEYFALVATEEQMVAALAQLAGCLSHLDPAWRISLNKRTKVLNPNFIADVMSVFALVSQSLRTGQALSQVLPSNLYESLLYHHAHTKEQQSDEEKRSAGDVENYIVRMQTEEFMYYAAGIASVAQMLLGLDELHRIAKRLCGEVPFKGYAEWKKEHDEFAYKSV